VLNVPTAQRVAGQLRQLLHLQQNGTEPVGRHYHYHVATITECEIPEGSGEFSVSGYTTFSPSPSLQGGKTRVLILVKNDLAVRANVKVIKDIMDPAVQSVWLHFSHHRIGSGSGSSTLGAFILGEFTGSGLPC
jgi:hypothetical protein